MPQIIQLTSGRVGLQAQGCLTSPLHPAASNIPQENKTMEKKTSYCTGFSKGT